MANAFSGIEGALAQFAVQAFEGEKAPIMAFIAKEEAALQAFVAAEIKANPLPGLPSFIVSYVDGLAEQFVSSYVAKYGPEALYDLVDALLKNAAAKVEQLVEPAPAPAAEAA